DLDLGAGPHVDFLGGREFLAIAAEGDGWLGCGARTSGATARPRTTSADPGSASARAGSPNTRRACTGPGGCAHGCAGALSRSPGPGRTRPWTAASGRASARPGTRGAWRRATSAEVEADRTTGTAHTHATDVPGAHRRVPVRLDLTGLVDRDPRVVVEDVGAGDAGDRAILVVE